MTPRTGLAAMLALILASWPMLVTAQSKQTVSISPVQSLAFGLLLPGLREVVPVTDATRRAVVALAGNGPIDVTLVLPSALETPTGDRIPLTFSSSDAALITTSGTTLKQLDPLQVNRVQLGNDRTVLLVLGGTAVTSAATRTGHYTARVALLVNHPGT
ncbi:MAG: hypothetical protein ACJ79A_06645 [Gemmatimonadaceae bacterium]